MAEQAADDLKGHIFIDEAHSNGVPELMCREVVEVLMASSDLAPLLTPTYNWLILVFGEPLGNSCTWSASPNQPFNH